MAVYGIGAMYGGTEDMSEEFVRKVSPASDSTHVMHPDCMRSCQRSKRVT
jgi:hypothetical protein